jgi:hypothetical protein
MLVDLAFMLVPVVPWVSLYCIVRYGPIRNRWWKGENVVGFALFVGGIAFSAGFFGPMVFAPGANQGPMLGIFYTGPAGLVVGTVWGAVRAWRRRTAQPKRSVMLQ